MTVKETIAQQGWPDLGLPDDFDSFIVKSTSAWNGELRLDGGYYDNETVLALLKLKDSGFEMDLIGTVAKTFNGNRFRRVHVDDAEHGVPYLSPSDMFDASLTKTRFLSKKHTGNLQNLLVQQGWTVITCSGSIGRCLYVSSELTEFVMSHDLIRVVANEGEVLPGYLYAYLNSELGNSLLTRSMFGKVIDHIEPHQVDGMSIPRLGSELEQEIHDHVVQADSCRSEANRLIAESEEAIYKRLGIQKVDPSAGRWAEQSLCFGVSSNSTSLRLDAGYHAPVVKAVERAVFSAAHEIRLLGSVTKDIFQPPIFKRIRVTDPKLGVPYYTGAELASVKPKPESYLSLKTPALRQLTLETNMVVVQDAGSAGGLIGKPTFIHKEFDGATATNNMIRITFEQDFDAGYCYAYLASQIGYQLVTRNLYGSAQDHLDVNQLSSVPIPWPDEDVRKEIGNLILRAGELRFEAQEHERHAQRILMEAIS